MKAIFHSIVIALFVGLVGCGKSEATKVAEQQAAERHDARQKFKEKIAGLKICTQSSTYSEFRQAELALRTSYEVNKSNLEDMRDQFVALDKLITACDYFWSYSVDHPTTNFRLTEENQANYTLITGLPPSGEVDTWPKHYVQKGFAKISDQTGEIMNLLEK